MTISYYNFIPLKLKALRETSGLSATDLNYNLKLGTGWIELFESGNFIPRVDEFLSILSHLSLEEATILIDHSIVKSIPFPRYLSATQVNKDIELEFPYGKYEAKYILENANLYDFLDLQATFQNDLAKGISINTSYDKNEDKAVLRNAVKNAFLKAVELFPNANPSDIWYFIISKLYIDPYNHPASNAKLDFSQSWKRTGGWALEEIVVSFYKDFLSELGINIFIESNKERKKELIKQFNVSERLEADKVDIFLTGIMNNQEILFGVVHVKASFAERRTDDVPMSKALVEAGYTSPLWTMDCKCTPSPKPFNKGELGVAFTDGVDNRSAKRKDIEDDNYFSNCFSYNLNTNPTAGDVKNRIIVCNFNNPNDSFSQFIIHSWNEFKLKL